jgi:hypothetical protein
VDGLFEEEDKGQQRESDERIDRGGHFSENEAK